jgi:hypothetical protein
MSGSLRWKIWFCRATCRRVARVFSSKSVGNNNNGNGVNHTNDAASLAARRNGALNSGSGFSFSASANRLVLSRSNSVSCAPRNGTTGTGATSNRVSGANRVLTFNFLFIFPFVVTSRLKRPRVKQKPRDCRGNRGVLEICKFA